MNKPIARRTSVFASICISFAVMVSALVTASPASAVGALDQQFSGNSIGYVSVTSTLNYAQRFTAGASGFLDRVTFPLAKFGSPGDLVVELYAVSGGTPTGNPIASVSVQQSSITTSVSAINFDFPTPAWVDSGSNYAFVIYAPNAVNVGSPLTKGYSFSIGILTPPGSEGMYLENTLWLNTHFGFWFSSYVTPGASPSPTSSSSSSASNSTSVPAPASLANTGINSISTLYLVGGGILLLALGLTVVNIVGGIRRTSA